MNRFSSRRQKLGRSIPVQPLKEAKAYDRIAGCFCGLILETAGEALASVQGNMRVAARQKHKDGLAWIQASGFRLPGSAIARFGGILESNLCYKSSCETVDDAWLSS